MWTAFQVRPPNGTMNEDTPVVVASATKEVVTQYVVYMTVEKEKRSCLEDTTVLGSFPPLPTQVITLAGNAPGKSSYDNVTGIPSGKKLNFHTLFTPGGNGIDVVLLGKYGLVRSMFNSSTELFSFQFSSMDGLDAMLENGPWFILNNPLILKKWHPDENLLKEDVSNVPGRSSNARVMIELQADVELKDNIVVAMPKITGEGHYICNVRVEYEWKPLRCANCKVFGHIHEECLKNTGAGEKKTVKKPSQTS
ncbi:reverse transcriptase domain-containing protein [Tanacetum coccineum]